MTINLEEFREIMRMVKKVQDMTVPILRQAIGKPQPIQAVIWIGIKEATTRQNKMETTAYTTPWKEENRDRNQEEPLYKWTRDSDDPVLRGNIFTPYLVHIYSKSP